MFMLLWIHFSFGDINECSNSEFFMGLIDEWKWVSKFILKNELYPRMLLKTDANKSIDINCINMKHNNMKITW